MPHVLARSLRWIERAVIDVLSAGSFAPLPPRRPPVIPDEPDEPARAQSTE